MNPTQPGTDTLAGLLTTGTIVDIYRVKGRLGEGAMSEVYLAIDEMLGRPVALKFIKGLSATDVERFLEESQITAGFNHPHIVTVYNSGVFGERPYLALEYLDGPSLRDRFDAGPMPVREAMRFGRAIAEALAQAHAKEIVHADLKPENVVIPRDGRARVVDFGLARLVGNAETAASGTPAYMAPERWAGATAMPPIDVWALALMLCEALDGKRPVSDRELVKLAYTPKVIELGPISAASPCRELLTRCLEIDPNARPSAADIAMELERLLTGGTADETRSPYRGLSAFTESDAADFYGRDDDVTAAVERLRTEGLVPIVGPSGVGKSSLVQAGIVPRLREQGPHIVLSLRPGRRPWLALTNVIASQGVEGAREVLEMRQSGALLRALRLIAAAKQAQVVLLVDQFEEAITLADPKEAEALIDALSVTALGDEPCRVLLSLRSDFLGNFAATKLGPSLGAVMVLHPLKMEDLELAVTAPLKRVGYRLDHPILANRIATELDGQAAALPLLQFVMDSLWRRRDSGLRLLLSSEYEAIGGATGALATHAERLALELNEPQRQTTRALVLQLVNLDGTRRPRTRQELLEAVGAGHEEALEYLLTMRLLTSGTSEETGAELVELAHESLTTTWPALARWLAETQDARALSHEIEQAARLWESRGRLETETWSGEALRDARRRAELWKLKLTALQEAFLVAGEQRQVRLHRQTVRRRTVIVIALSVLALAASATAIVFRQKEQYAISQQKEIRTAAADMGRFVLRLEPFDWDAEAMAPHPVDAARLANLEVRFHNVDKAHEFEPGPLVDPAYVVRSDAGIVDGGRNELIELRSAPTWIEIAGRGADDERCSSSFLLANGLPGYAERSTAKEISLKIPTCQATYAGTVEIPAGPFFNSVEPYNDDAGMVEVDLAAFRIDQFEVTQEAFRQYDSARDITGDSGVFHLDEFANGRSRLPMGMVDGDTAQRYCLFMGKKLESVDEWTKASRGGVWLDAEHSVRNPDPRRLTVWGTPEPLGINVPRDDHEVALAAVGSASRDRSPYGVFDLAGNMREWSRTKSGSDESWANLQFILGASWVDRNPEVVGMALFRIDHPATAYSFSRLVDHGIRCVSE